jgi:hypothetical protein
MRIAEMKKFKERCGNCRLWMILDQCPCEYEIIGGHKGPSMDGGPCDEYIRDTDRYPIKEDEK